MASITTAISGKAGSISGTPGSGDIGSEITEWSIDDTVESLEATNMRYQKSNRKFHCGR